MSEPCEIRTASDGTPVRVHGQIRQDVLDAITAQVRAIIDSRCDAESNVPMPAIAQRIHGHEHYTCGRVKGHDGPHRWPEVDMPGKARVEWESERDE
jgi:hypothetical protein